MAATKINDVADYIIVKLDEAGVGMNILKLQKLLYYVQAWSLAFRGETLFAGKFQAWVHGPVNREIYDRFVGTHMMYALLSRADIQKGFDFNEISEQARSHIDEILDTYARYTGTQLEGMTHDEAPWVQARGDRKPAERCETEIDEALMKDFYSQELKKFS